jgi:hypothetical protein
LKVVFTSLKSQNSPRITLESKITPITNLTKFTTCELGEIESFVITDGIIPISITPHKHLVELVSNKKDFM